MRGKRRANKKWLEVIRRFGVDPELIAMNIGICARGATVKVCRWKREDARLWIDSVIFFLSKGPKPRSGRRDRLFFLVFFIGPFGNPLCTRLVAIIADGFNGPMLAHVLTGGDVIIQLRRQPRRSRKPFVNRSYRRASSEFLYICIRSLIIRILRCSAVG